MPADSLKVSLEEWVGAAHSLGSSGCIFRPLKAAVFLLCVHPLLTSACFTYELLTALTFLHTCPTPQLVTVLIQGTVRGGPLYWQLMDQPNVIPPITGSLPLPLGLKIVARPSLLLTAQVGCWSKTLLQTSKPPHALNWVSVADSGLPFFLELGRYRVCGPGGGVEILRSLWCNCPYLPLLHQPGERAYCHELWCTWNYGWLCMTCVWKIKPEQSCSRTYAD